MTSRTSPILAVFALGLVAQICAANPLNVDDKILRSIEEAKDPVFSLEIQEMILGLPPLQEILAKGDTDITEEIKLAKERLSRLKEAAMEPSLPQQSNFLEATGIVLLLAKDKGSARVKGALSCVCLDKARGIFVTALHPFQQSDDSDSAIVIGPDGRIAGVTRVLLRNAPADFVLFTTRQAYSGEISGIGNPPRVGDLVWVSGSCPGATFFQFSARVARASIPNFEMFGRLRAKWFDLDKGFPSGISGGGVFDTQGRLVGLAMRNIAVTSHETGGAPLNLGRAIEMLPLIDELR